MLTQSVFSTMIGMMKKIQSKIATTYQGQYSVVPFFVICLQFQVAEPRRGQKTKHS